MPFDLNQLEVTGGYPYFEDRRREPNVDLVVSRLEVEGENPSNVHHADREQPGRRRATGLAFGSGALDVDLAATSATATGRTRTWCADMRRTRADDDGEASSEEEKRWI